MQIVIDIPDDIYQHIAVFRHFSTYDKKYLIDAFKNCTVLPENHRRLIDADAFERRCMFDKNIEDMQDVIYALRDYPAIIEGTEGKE